MATNSRIEAIERATGRSWEDWLAFMERIGAADLDHHAIATQLLYELDGMVDNVGWWAQSTAVAFEQYSGRRIPGQQPDGTFRLSVSKATSLGMHELMTAWTEFAATEPAVLGMLVAEPRVSGTENRISWRAKGVDDTAITVLSEPKKGAGTASLVVQHGGLASPDVSADTREVWVGVVERFMSGLTT